MLWQRAVNKSALQDTEAAELLFPVKRVENSLEGMDYCEAELTVCVCVHAPSVDDVHFV